MPCLERRIPTLLRVLIAHTDGIDAASLPAEGHDEWFIHGDLATLLRLDSCNNGDFDLLPHIAGLVQRSLIWILMRLCLQLALRVPHVSALRKEC